MRPPPLRTLRSPFPITALAVARRATARAHDQPIDPLDLAMRPLLRAQSQLEPGAEPWS